MNCFIIGTCRVWRAAERRNNWTVSKDFKKSTIQAYNSREILQIINWLNTKPTLTKEEMSCFLPKFPMTQNRWKTVRQNYQTASKVFVEISSLKVCKFNGKIHGVENGKAITLMMNKDQVAFDINRIEALLRSKNKKVLFFSHVNCYTNRDMGYFHKRHIIALGFKKAVQQGPIMYINPFSNNYDKTKNSYYFTPSALVAHHGQKLCLIKRYFKEFDCEYDVNHYTPFCVELVCQVIDKLYSQ